MINNVAVDDPITAETMNALIDSVNGSPNRVVLLADTVWAVPAGVQRFKVTLCGGGGRGGNAGLWAYSEYFIITAGGEGGDAPMISAIFSGVEEGQSFPVTVGDGGSGPTPVAGTATSFGLLVSGGGAAGGAGPNSSQASGVKGNPGTASFPPGAPSMFHGNELFGYTYVNKEIRGYGRGGAGDPGGSGALPGHPGIVVIEW